jgi:hypothetical protein
MFGRSGARVGPAAVLPLLFAGCGAAPPAGSSAVAAPPAAAASAAPNAAPVIAGEDHCIGPEGTVHVFDLVLTDPDGDRVSWRAWTERPRGELTPVAGAALASGTTIRLVYTPARGPDENTIVVLVRDERGATATKTLYVRSG